ncbi:MAG: hypothetical protein J6K45_07145 [Clostridia bacterium]|nr:hypothetical protein [Clostridia bacterium]
MAKIKCNISGPKPKKTYQNPYQNQFDKELETFDKSDSEHNNVRKMETFGESNSEPNNVRKTLSKKHYQNPYQNNFDDNIEY